MTRFLHEAIFFICVSQEICKTRQKLRKCWNFTVIDIHVESSKTWNNHFTPQIWIFWVNLCGSRLLFYGSLSFISLMQIVTKSHRKKRNKDQLPPIFNLHSLRRPYEQIDKGLELWLVDLIFFYWWVICYQVLVLRSVKPVIRHLLSWNHRDAVSASRPNYNVNLRRLKEYLWCEIRHILSYSA